LPQTQKPVSNHLEAVLRDIQYGSLDDHLIQIIEAVNVRKDALKARVDELVRLTYGSGARVITNGPEPERVNLPKARLHKEIIETDEGPVEVEVDETGKVEFPEPIVSGTIYERMQAGLGPAVDVLPVEVITQDGGPGDADLL